MRVSYLLAVIVAVVLFLGLAQPAAAVDGDTSTASITSFSQTNPSDGADFWPDGTDVNTTTNYAVSMNVATGWVKSADAADTFSSDGDVLSFVCNWAGGTDDDYVYNNGPQLTGVTQVYVEIRYQQNETSTKANSYVYLYPTDTMGGTGQLVRLDYLVTAGVWYTMKQVVTITGVQCVALRVKETTDDCTLKVDYLRVWSVAGSQPSGWQHDCSATGNTTANGGAAVSSDGDKLTMTGPATSGSIDVWVDGTATQSCIDGTYYPMLTVSVTSIYTPVSLYGYYGTSSLEFITQLTAVQTYYLNLEALRQTDWKGIRFSLNLNENITVDWVTIYGIANWTVTQALCEVDDYVYVSASALMFELDGNPEYIMLNLDPAMAIAVATYNVWNLTMSSYTTTSANDWGFRCVVGGVWWSWVYDNTRGQCTGTGTLTDIDGFVSYISMKLSAVKFITDATKPDVVRAGVAPLDADDTEVVTLSAVATDTVEVYQVHFDAITYPVGYSDTARYATEIADNLWTYSFTTLTAGYYCFKVVVSDGANVNDLDYYSYLDFTVREAEIIVTTITLFGAGDDFDFVTWTFNINRACTYTIREWSATYAAADTWTGSVAEGIRNIAWPKLSLTDDYVNFTVTFVNGSLSYAFSSSYAMPKSTFYFITAPITDEGHEYAVPIVWCSGLLSKPATYTVYVDDTESSSGNTSATFYLETNKGVPRGQDHEYAFRFVNGSQTLWVNCTFYTYAANEDQDELGGGADWRTSQDWWTNLFVFGCFLGIIYIGARVGEKKQTAGYGNLPNYGRGKR